MCVDRDSVMVVGRRRHRRVPYSARPDEHRGPGRPDPPPRADTGQLSPRRLDPPTSVDSAATVGGVRCDQSVRSALDASVCAGAGGEDRSWCRPAHPPPGHRHARTRRRLLDRTRSDLSGYWVDGDIVHIGSIRIGAGASIGARSFLAPGSRVGKNAEVEAGSAVFGRVKASQHWAGSPAQKTGKAEPQWPSEDPPRGARWVPVFGVTSILLAGLPIMSIAPVSLCSSGG